MFSRNPQLDSWVQQHLACPRDFKPLEILGDRLRCPENHAYPVVNGVPILLLEETVPTQKEFWKVLKQPETFSKTEAAEVPDQDGIDPFVKQALPATSGGLYNSVAAGLRQYPIPELPLPDGHGAVFLDLGCNWGRWCLSAGRKGYWVIGIDPNLEAVLAARRVSVQLNIPGCFLVADARHLPFASHCVDTVFSYSVLQHFHKEEARKAFKEASRVLKAGGTAFIEMPNAFGLHNLLHQLKRGFRQARDFEVRYWTPAELVQTFNACVGPARLIADGYFSLNSQAADLHLLPFPYRLVVRISEWLREKSLVWPWLVGVADSLYVQSTAAPKTN